MSASQTSQGQMIAAAGGALLFIFLFLPWFGAGGDSNLSGWEGQSTTDLYLLITAVVAIGAALTGGVVLPGLTMNGATALLGGVGTILLLWLVLFDFPDGADREIGLYLSLIAVAAVAGGGYAAAQGDVGGARSERF
jgi:hypothetical protein